jgi:glycerate 2-kinase
MPLHVLIVPDKFKGTLSAQRAAALIAQGWREVRPQDRLEVLPMSDGGDGFGEVLAGLSSVEPRASATVDAAHRPCQATWWWDPDRRLALIESARVIGLSVLPAGKYHPFALDTYGLGRVLEDARMAGAQQCLMGIGGSATNDGGFGLARACGWNFSGLRDTPIQSWTGLADLAHISGPALGRSGLDLLVAVDVQNPLLGPNGATRVYGPQKGLRAEDFPLAEACLSRLAEVAGGDLEVDVALEPGTGAAGGLGFGLRCFLGARLESGFSLFARQARLEERIGLSDLVLTGEGAIDASTLMGKGVGEIARLCRGKGVPCVGLAGTLVGDPSVSDEANLFTQLHGMAPGLVSHQEAKAHPELWLPRLAALAAAKRS